MISHHARGVAEPVAPSADSAPGGAPFDNATPGSAPAQDAPARRRGSWSRRCPLCLSSALLVARTGILECAACETTLPPPPREADLPAWELDLRARPWDEYSRPGRLLEEWGRSTDREDAPFGDRERGDELPPRVRAAAGRGLQAALRDVAIHHHPEQTQALVLALDTMRRYMGRLHGAEPAKRRRAGRAKRRGRAGIDLGELLLDHTAEVMGEAPRSPEEPAAPPPWFGSLCAAMRAVLEGELRALALLAVNALRRRGVEYDGSLDPIHPRAQRAEPFAGLRHAIRGAFGTNDSSSSSSSIPFSAMGTHKLPQGVQFGRMAVRPSKARSATPREPSTNAGDVWEAIRAARVGVRTRWEGGQLVREPGRALTEAEIELVRLVDGGLVSLAITERRGGITRVVSDAVEQLHPRDAVVRLRGLEGAPRTEREARLALKAARRAIAHVLEDRGLIPVLARDNGASSRARAPSSDPFVGVGSGS